MIDQPQVWNKATMSLTNSSIYDGFHRVQDKRFNSGKINFKSTISSCLWLSEQYNSLEWRVGK